MFKFDFQLEDPDEEVFTQPQPSVESRSSEFAGGTSVAGPSKITSTECHHVTLDDLLKTLPETISYSPLVHPCLSSPILRRDLFDARFQLINRSSSSSKDAKLKEENRTSALEGSTQDEEEEEGGEGEGEEYVDAATDLIPGLYEGGLKTWEGGVDLVDVLSSAGSGSEEKVGEWVKGGSVLEVGCGTALPTAYLLRSLLSTSHPRSSSANPANQKTILHLQDYNLLVLQLVTLPNLLLASLPFLPPESLHAPEDEEDVEDVLPDLEQPGNLDVTPVLLDAFKSLLVERGITLQFTYGHWEGLSAELRQGKKYGLVLTAETIYSEGSNQPLLDVLKSAIGTKTKSDEEKTSQVHREEVRLEDSLESLSVGDDWVKIPLCERQTGFTLVAAKVLYFGVGGGLQGFLERVEKDGGSWSPVKEWIKGVGRKVVQVTF